MEAHSLPVPGGLTLPRSRRMLVAFSDARLVDQVRRGNEAAFETIFDRHHRAILSFCRHMLGSADEAEDAVQQTFVSAYDAMCADTRELKLKAWLYAIARNKCLSMLRARRERATELADVPTAGLAEEVQHRADLRELLHDMRDLPEDQRAALVLSELGDLSHADIGTVLGCDPLKVKSLVFQARSSLIENRNARETPCLEIREQLAVARGGALRRGPLRKHLKACVGCRAFRDDVARQRAMTALVLPVIPSVGLKSGALAAIGIGGGGGAGIVAGGSAAGGAAAALGAGGGAGAAATAGGLKLATAVVATAVAVGGSGLAVSEVAHNGAGSQGAPGTAVRESAPPAGTPAATGTPAAIPLVSPSAGLAPGAARDNAVVQGPGAAPRSPVADERLASKDERQTREHHGTSGHHSGPKREHSGGQQTSSGQGSNAGSNAGSKAGSNSGENSGSSSSSNSSGTKADRDTTRASAPTQERKTSHGPRAIDQPLGQRGVQVPEKLPDTAAAVAAQQRGKVRTPRLPAGE
jgi:RNA polymerase sigma factor (sigma-70 family)